MELGASGIPTLVPAIDISVVCFPSLWREAERERERERAWKERLYIYYLACFYVNFNDPPLPGSPKSKSPLQIHLHTHAQEHIHHSLMATIYEHVWMWESIYVSDIRQSTVFWHFNLRSLLFHEGSPALRQFRWLLIQKDQMGMRGEKETNKIIIILQIYSITLVLFSSGKVHD